MTHRRMAVIASPTIRLWCCLYACMGKVVGGVLDTSKEKDYKPTYNLIYLTYLISGISLILFLYTLLNPSELFFLKTLVCIGCFLASLQDERHGRKALTSKFKMLHLRNQRSYAPGCWSALYSLDCAVWRLFLMTSTLRWSPNLQAKVDHFD
uniref:Uncharacterized protein n=1 Tax=Glossina austeni TaxID=7395 RepID=A0A1A9UTT2_GLOAU